MSEACWFIDMPGSKLDPDLTIPMVLKTIALFMFRGLIAQQRVESSTVNNNKQRASERNREYVVLN
jgi:hypothetical protein